MPLPKHLSGVMTKRGRKPGFKPTPKRSAVEMELQKILSPHYHVQKMLLTHRDLVMPS